MAGLAQSMIILPVTASAFAARQLGNLLSNGGTHRMQTDLYRATKKIESEFASDPVVFGAYQVGAEAQSGAVDLLWDIARLRFLQPEWLDRTGGSIAEWSCGAARTLTPGDNLTAYVQTVRNTFDVINLVNRASSLLDLPPGAIQLSSAISRAYSYDDYSALWIVEGLGEQYADRNWSGDRTRGLLNTGQGADADEKSLLMLHAGIGISFARRIVSRLTPFSGTADVATGVRRFIELVRANSRPGYEGAAFESLGLVTRTWYAEMVDRIDEQLWNADRTVLEFYWHGVGRSIYFSPLYLLPGFTAFQGVRREVPNELARLNATAGAAWAFTLVNIRTPEVLANLVRTSGEIVEDDAFTNGLMSTVIMAGDMVPNDPVVSALCDYTPHWDSTQLLLRWTNAVQRPCRVAAQVYHPVLQQQRKLGGIFRYRDLSGINGSLESVT
jgi:hypothetical protein